MTNKNTPPIRLNEDFISLLDKAQVNRIKLGIDKKTIGYPRMSKLIERYFKLLSEDKYIEFINMEEQNA